MNDRPSPEALLQQAAREGQGRLKLFLGAAPGVGKTYAMLRAAQHRRGEGVDVCVALIETHGRSETEAQLAGLELLPRRQVAYRGREFAELDVDAILARRPQLVLVDEFAHANVPGSPHPKRYQDIDDLLAAGIDVWSTLNVQHIESLNDVVARVTGVEVRETVPDAALARADEIELIDLPPEDLIRRLRDGKVYVPEQARQALHQFFGRGALTALRELAMRVAAERVDAQLLEYKQVHGVGEVWPTRERLLVAVDDADIGQAVIRSARRIAENRRIPWIAVHVETPRSRRQPAAARERVARNLRLAQRLGAQVMTLPGNDPVEALIDCARRENASQLVVGRSSRRRWLRWPGKPLSTRLVERADPLEVTVVTWQGEAPPTPAPHRTWLHWPAWRFDTTALALALAAVATITALLLVFGQGLSVDGKAMFYLLGTVAVAARFGVWPSMLCAVASFLAYNFFFTVPKLTLHMARLEELRPLFSFLVVALLTGRLGGRVRDQLEEQRNSNARISALGRFGEQLAGATERREIVAAVADHLHGDGWDAVALLLPDEHGTLVVQPGSSTQSALADGDIAAARWAYRKGRPAGWQTDTLPSSRWLFLPLTSGERTRGVLALYPQAGVALDESRQRALDAVADLTTVAIERALLVEDLEKSRLSMESEQLRTALLSSVSHDLRTPLALVLGAAETLHSRHASLAAEERDTLVTMIAGEAARLDRFIQNLLDMTRLSSGGLQLKWGWHDLLDIAARARQRLPAAMQRRRVDFEGFATLPLVRIDGVLIEQVFLNLLENALKYSPETSAVRVEAEAVLGACHVRVIDAGIGIPESEREHVFDMFTRVRERDSRVAGTGLGLSICKGFVEAHGGRIRVLDTPGGGTTVAFVLPVELKSRHVGGAAA